MKNDFTTVSKQLYNYYDKCRCDARHFDLRSTKKRQLGVNSTVRDIFCHGHFNSTCCSKTKYGVFKNAK